MYKLDGKEIKYLNRLVLATVKQYIEDNKEVTYQELKNIFKNDIQGSYGVVKNESDLESLKKYIIDTPKRFFMKEDEILKLSNGDKIYVCKGWGDDYTDSNGKYKKGNKKAFLELIIKLNYDLELLDTNPNIDNLTINDAINKFIDTLDINENNEPKVGKEFKTKSRSKTYYVYTNRNRNIMTKPLDGMREFSQSIPVFERYLKTGLINQDNDSSYIIPIGDYIREHYLEHSSKKINYIKNIILYGAPGVGKTHNYRNLISMIEDGESQKEIFDIISKNDKVSLDNETFETVKKEKRVEFITFHQSYSYEDFIEGFRPNEEGNIELEDGIFKNLCDKAIENSSKYYATEKLTFSDALNILLSPIKNDETVKIALKKDNSYFEIYDYNKKSLYYTRQGKNSDEKYHTLSISTLNKMYNEEENNFLTGGLKTYYLPLLKNLLKIGKEKKVEKTERKNFYIVIDEINRGNISKIFGELITLIEEDKRDSYEVTLPYSKELFKVPSNLYIIATMNSTDKSIATIDIALRRRFIFLKMKPNLELVSDIAKELFTNLNSFIEEHLSEDYKLGHSYFMKIQTQEDLEFVKEYKIKPLLEEYFYADEDNYKKAMDILNQSLKESNDD